MKIDQVLQTYDKLYATEYNDTFLTDVWVNNSVAFQLDLLKGLLKNSTNWLDVACGTGFVLSQFPEVNRAGLDISPAMLEVAKRRNEGVSFYNGNFLDPHPEWEGRWDVVSCMWWAYCMVESISEMRKLIANLARWTADRGTCFVPLCNPQKFDAHNIKIPYIDPKVPGKIMITGITWTWIQENGKRHDDVVSPQVEHMITMFKEHFKVVEIVEGPIESIGEGWRVQDVLLASEKRSQRGTGENLLSFDEEQDNTHTWLLGCQEDNLASLIFPNRNSGLVRISIEKSQMKTPWEIQVNRTRISIKANRRYSLSLQARADRNRRMSFGVFKVDGSWECLGLYKEVELGSDWRVFHEEFVSTADTDNARIHFDVGKSDVAIELTDVVLNVVDV